MARSPIAFLVDQSGNIVGVVERDGNYRLMVDATVSGLVGINESQTGGLNLETTQENVFTTVSGVNVTLEDIRDISGIAQITNALPSGNNVLGKIQLTSGSGDIGVTLHSGVRRLNQISVITDGVSTVGIKDDSGDKRLLVEAQLAPGNSVTVTPANPQNIIKNRLEYGGSDNLLVDGGSSPTVFSYNADPTQNVRLVEIRFVMVADAIECDGAHFGPISTVASGVKLEVQAGGSLSEIAVVKQTEDFLDFYSPGGIFFDRTGLKDIIVAAIHLGGAPVLEAGSSDFVKVTVQDDLTAVDFQHFT